MSDHRDPYGNHPPRMIEGQLVPKGAFGGLKIDLYDELHRARARARRLEDAARAMVEAQDAELRPNGSVACLRFVNTEALKGLLVALQHGPEDKTTPPHPKFGFLRGNVFKCDPPRTREEDMRISDRAMQAIREGREDSREFEIALDVLLLRGELARLQDRLAKLERQS
jgi:hypothetical protein